MSEAIQTLDWWVIGIYLAGLILFSLYLSRKQFSREDYYVGHHAIGPWPIAISTMATQCSTNSILGAPAFVAFAAGGGLIWLQYEMAVPLAMIAIMIFLFPVFFKLQLISVYAYLESRFDLKTRLVLSILFQFVRAFATAVTVYSIAIVVELITGLGFFWSVLIIGAITLVYDTLGGIKGVIYSDVLQLIILTVVLVGLLVLLVDDIGGLFLMFDNLSGDRRQTLDFSAHGLGDGEVFAFWPMLIGGFFLYVSYYGCDQSQVQRELCAHSMDDGKKALFLNGVLRFPLVLLYCLVGVGLAAYSFENPGLLTSLPTENGAPNYNLAVPQYMALTLPPGVLGLALVALFAAAMSSLDSVINSLSAVTMEDFVFRFHQGTWSEKKELWISRLITLIWGSITLIFAFFVGDIADTVLEAINIIGSLVNGPILAVFAMGLLTQRVSRTAAVSGLLAGFLFNLYCWWALPGLSWLWWNVFGFLVTAVTGLILSLALPCLKDVSEYTWHFHDEGDNLGNQRWRKGYCWLIAYAGIILVVLILMAL